MSNHMSGSSYELNKRMKQENRDYELNSKPVMDIGAKKPVLDTTKKTDPQGNSFHNGLIMTRKNQSERGVFGVNSLRIHL